MLYPGLVSITYRQCSPEQIIALSAATTTFLPLSGAAMFMSRTATWKPLSRSPG